MKNLKNRMVEAMFTKIKKDIARDDMKIQLKDSNTEITVFHWHGYNKGYHINLIECDDNNACIRHELLAEDFKSWSDAFDWLADYILKEV